MGVVFGVPDIHEAQARARGLGYEVSDVIENEGDEPYVDETKAAVITGSRDFVLEGQAAQARAVVLLENKRIASTGQPLLPVAAKNKKVYLYGVAAKAAEVLIKSRLLIFINR